MCKKTNYQSSNTRVDECIRSLIKYLNVCDYKTVASCCGHGKYPVTVVIRWMLNGKPMYNELFTGKIIHRSRRFYKKDAEGYYFIPEVK